jgi:hypothetical protein
MGTQQRPAHQPTKVDQKIARLRDSIATKITGLERSLARAHFVVGKIMLSNPDLLIPVMPQLEPHLGKLGSARAAVDNYSATVAELKHLKGLSL